MAVLAESELQSQVAGMEGWEVRDGALEKSYDRGDFDGSMAFVNGVAEAANAADHHPDISISWNTVDLTLSTHSEGGLTENDFELATRIDSLA